MSDSFQERILDKLDEQSVLLATIATEVKNLQIEDDTLMLKIDRLEDRVRSLELKLAFASVLGTLITLIGSGIAYLLSK